MLRTSVAPLCRTKAAGLAFCRIGRSTLFLCFAASAIFCFALLVGAAFLSTIGLPAPAQSTGTDHPDFPAKYIESFSGPGNLRWTLPPALDITLRIVAGTPDIVPEDLAMKAPIAVTTDTHDRVLVADEAAMAVHVLDFASRKYWDLDLQKNGLESVGGVAVDRNGKIYVTDPRGGKIFTFTSKGKPLGMFQQRKGKESDYEAPVGIAIDEPRADIYVCDRDRNMVIKVNHSGRMLAHFGVRGGGSGPGDFRKPTQIAIAGGNLFVLDAGNERVQQLEMGGKFVRQFLLMGAAGLAVDGSGRIIASEPAMHGASVYQNDGKLIGSFRTSEADQSGITDPEGLWIADGRCLYLADKGARKVELFELGGGSGKECRPRR
jgi:outer membrane protein assembly factor BamB